jgi:predicted enzyme related to lactoylglutathione lyase
MKIYFTIIAFLFFNQLTLANEQTHKNPKHMNPGIYFEIPVVDLERAIHFYTNVFGYKFERQNIHGNEMALFPFSENNKGITGALAKGEIYIPTRNGVVIYLQTKSIDETTKLALTHGSEILFPKTLVDDIGFVAEISDSEGNRIALQEFLKD